MGTDTRFYPKEEKDTFEGLDNDEKAVIFISYFKIPHYMSKNKKACDIVSRTVGFF